MTSTPDARHAVRAWLADRSSLVDYTAMEYRFWAMTDAERWIERGNTRACVEWLGATSHDNRGIFIIKGVSVNAGRVAVRLGLHVTTAWRASGMTSTLHVSSEAMGEVMCPPRAVPTHMIVVHTPGRTSNACVNPLHLEVARSSLSGKRVTDLSVFT